MLVDIKKVTIGRGKGAVDCKQAEVSLAVSEHGVAIRAVPVDADGKQYPETPIRLAARGKSGSLEKQLIKDIGKLISKHLADKGH